MEKKRASNSGSCDGKLHTHHHDAPTRAARATPCELRPRPRKQGPHWRQEKRWQAHEGGRRARRGVRHGRPLVVTLVMALVRGTNEVLVTPREARHLRGTSGGSRQDVGQCDTRRETPDAVSNHTQDRKHPCIPSSGDDTRNLTPARARQSNLRRKGRQPPRRRQKYEHHLHTGAQVQSLDRKIENEVDAKRTREVICMNG